VVAVPEMPVQGVVVDLEGFLGMGTGLVADGDAGRAAALLGLGLETAPVSMPPFRLAVQPRQTRQGHGDRPGEGAASRRRTTQGADDCVESLRVHGVLHC
jgi:hypothetical protein